MKTQPKYARLSVIRVNVSRGRTPPDRDAPPPSGFGVDQLRDDNLETYWQSDGSQPHLVNIQFRFVLVCLLPVCTTPFCCLTATFMQEEDHGEDVVHLRRLQVG